MSTNLKSFEAEKTLLVSGLASKNELLRDLLSYAAVRDFLLPELNVVPLTTNQVPAKRPAPGSAVHPILAYCKQRHGQTADVREC